MRQQGRIIIHVFQGFAKFVGARMEVRHVVQCGSVVRVNVERLMKQVVRLLVALPAHQPVGRQIVHVLVAREHRNHVIHGCDPGQVVPFLHVGNPLDHQSLAR